MRIAALSAPSSMGGPTLAQSWAGRFKGVMLRLHPARNVLELFFSPASSTSRHANRCPFRHVLCHLLSLVSLRWAFLDHGPYKCCSAISQLGSREGLAEVKTSDR